jgi:peptidoglycan/LPS O-acetylase OafA/YrhL
MKNAKRLYGLDYLRGLAAFGIMVFHYLTWTIGEFDSASVAGRIGRYGVGIFYVLSGLTLYYVYAHEKQLDLRALRNFYIKRFFRIYPLLWLTMVATIVITHAKYSLEDLVYNFTGLFGLFRWNEYIGIGVWSIGNELVFYLVFPLFVLLSRKYLLLFYGLVFLLLGLHIWFAFFVLTPELPLNDQWSEYVNPLNQVFLFTGGYVIGLLLENKQFLKTANSVLLLSGILCFAFYPAQGDTIHILWGTNRLIFTLICFVICIGFYKNRIELPGPIHTFLTQLGEGSYSLYLLHPIVWVCMPRISKHILSHFFYVPPSIMLVLSMFLSLLASHIVYRYFEKYFMRKGKKLSELPAKKKVV